MFVRLDRLTKIGLQDLETKSPSLSLSLLPEDALLPDVVSEESEEDEEPAGRILVFFSFPERCVGACGSGRDNAGADAWAPVSLTKVMEGAAIFLWTDVPALFAASRCLSCWRLW